MDLSDFQPKSARPQAHEVRSVPGDRVPDWLGLCGEADVWVTSVFLTASVSERPTDLVQRAKAGGKVEAFANPHSEEIATVKLMGSADVVLKSWMTLPEAVRWAPTVVSGPHIRMNDLDIDHRRTTLDRDLVAVCEGLRFWATKVAAKDIVNPNVRQIETEKCALDHRLALIHLPVQSWKLRRLKCLQQGHAWEEMGQAPMIIRRYCASCGVCVDADGTFNDLNHFDESLLRQTKRKGFFSRWFGL